MNVLGGPLEDRDYQALVARWITPAIADSALLRRVDSITGQELVGRSGAGRYDGLAIPYVWPGEDQVREYRLRRDHPDLEPNGSGFKEVGKYLSPPGRGNKLYFVPGTCPKLLEDTEVPIVITEGEFKTQALWRLSWHVVGDTAESPSFLPIGLSGVWNWRGIIGKMNDADGVRVDQKGPIPDLSRIIWNGRRVTILFDADADRNPKVQDARRHLTRELESRGAEVFWFLWSKKKPPELKGIDDFLAVRGPEEVLTLLSKAQLRTKWKAGSANAIERPDLGQSWKAGVPLITNKDGDPKALLANAITALRNAPEWNGVLAYDEFAMRTSARKPPPWTTSACSVWATHEDLLTTDWLQHVGIHVSLEIAGQAIEAVAKEQSFHPVREYLDGLVWDGIQRLDTWLPNYLGVAPTKYSLAVGLKWMISAVARIYQPGCKADCCLILEGAQGIKKSTALWTIAHPWFADEIADLGSKDAALQTRGVWLIEIAELDSMNRSEVGRTKAFMSRATDRFRPPYAKRPIESPRECVFAGTVNHATYLRDETGGRRFWPVACGAINIEALEKDRDQLWAEARARYQNKESWWLDSTELHEAAAKEQTDRHENDAWHEVITAWLKHPVQRSESFGQPVPSFSSDRDSVSLDDVLVHCIGKRLDQWGQADKNSVARCLTAAGWERYREWDTVEQKSGPWRYRRAKKK